MALKISHELACMHSLRYVANSIGEARGILVRSGEDDYPSKKNGTEFPSIIDL